MSHEELMDIDSAAHVYKCVANATSARRLREDLAMIHILDPFVPQGAVGHDVELRPEKLLANRKEDHREIAITICRNPVWVGVQDQGLICLSLCGNGFNAVAKSGWHNERR